MTATTPKAPAPTERTPGRGPIWVIRDTIVVMRRNLLKYVRVPTLLVFSTIQPIMFVLLFAFVFGGAIRLPGIDYIDFLMAGIFVQTYLLKLKSRKFQVLAVREDLNLDRVEPEY